MADIKEILQKGIRFGAVRMVRLKQLDDVVEGLLRVESITREHLEEAGKEIVGDRLLFIDVDVDQLNKALTKIKKTGVRENNVCEDAPLS